MSYNLQQLGYVQLNKTYFDTLFISVNEDEINPDGSINQKDKDTEPITKEDEEKIRTELIDLEIQRSHALGKKVVATFSDYYRFRLKQDIKMQKEATPLPKLYMIIILNMVVLIAKQRTMIQLL